jgi:tRNA pseudouridine38-40 synthase
MHNFKLTLAYDGTEFHGWQIQPGQRTVQGLLAEVAEKLTGERVFVHGASRTDAGVHALGQAAHFRTASNLTAGEFQRAFNALLPPTIRVLEAEEVGPDFHARWQAQAKTYQYRIFRGRVVPPFDWRYTLHYPLPLDETAMAEAARAFEGEHDFTSFAASTGSEEEDRDRTTVRVIYRSEMIRCQRPVVPGWPPGTTTQAEGESGGLDELIYVVRGKSFLRHMVRKIVGTLLEVGKGTMTPADIDQLFSLRDRSRSGPTVPPQGLYLVSIEYPEPWKIEPAKK